VEFCAGDVEILRAAQGLNPIVSLSGDLFAADGIAFGTKCHIALSLIEISLSKNVNSCF
jgi:hypothetical protein